ncbi:MAG TPA: sugar-binding domain-containing protein [Intrasporangium sp.]|uniref:sugar-binding transcriptional regulator n=1 Tax=Intrasporangium sp. TaxID=1925024 RepID=UPI002D7811AE|nr:sugar-binding domain-containing protein [Intrasporangium sp.]HET7397173.1 sugar-binding domain-containing protein [Intrasporangium sp.]
MTVTPGPAELVLAAEVARRYYLHDQRKVDIAASLGISRFKVARLLEEARASGLVRIEIVNQWHIESELSVRLREALALRNCVVVETEEDPSVARAAVGRAGAALLSEVIGPHDVLGMPWARSVSAMVHALTQLPRVPVVQLSGSQVVAGGESPVDMVRAAARLSGGDAYVYFAPLVLDDAASARVLLRQPAVSAAMAQVPRVTIAAIGIGGWGPGRSTIYDAVSEGTRAAVARAGAVGEALGIFFDSEGAPLHTELSDRMVTITADALRGIPEVIGLVSGVDKATAVLAAARGPLVSSLVVDSGLGRELLRLAGG